MEIRQILIFFISSFVLSFVLIRIFIRFSLKKKLLMNRKGIPLVGGVGIGMSFIFLSYFFLSSSGLLTSEAKAIIIASCIVLFFGLWDDVRELSIGGKLVFEFICVYILIRMGARTYIAGIPEFLNMAITFLWVLACINAVNHLDVMDGFCSGCAIISGLGFLFVSALNQDTVPFILSLVFIGATAGFFMQNFPRGKIYMGNTGSHFLGFILAGIGMVISYAPMERKIALLSPVLVMGYPLFDTLFLIVARSRKKILPLKKSDDHLVLIHVRRGDSKHRVLGKFCLLSVFFCTGGVILSRAGNLGGLGIVLFYAVAGMYLLARNLKKLGL